MKAKHRDYANAHKDQYRSQHLRFLYGIEWEDKVRMYEEQHGLCECCGEPLPPVDDLKTHTEHNHTTGKIRGLVHARCNRVISVVENTPHLVSAAQVYLKKHS